MDIGKDYIAQMPTNRAFGRYFNSRYCKRFSISIEGDYEDLPSHGVYILPYDIRGKRITVPQSDGLVCVNGPGWPDAYFGTSFRTQVSTPNEIQFEVGSEVDSFALLVSFEAEAKVRSILVEQIINTGNTNGDTAVSSTSPFDWMNGSIYVEGVPRAGRWEKGQVLTEANPSADGPAFYICLTSGDFSSGTPPTFGKFGKIEKVR